MKPPASAEPWDVRLSVVIPSYNESHRLPATLEEIAPYLHSHFSGYEVIVVDDGSTDETASLVSTRSMTWPQLRLLRQPRNLGKGAAVRRGCLDATGDLVLFMDADHAVPIEELDRFMEESERQSVDAVVGVRTYQTDESRGRRIIGLVLQILAHTLVFRRAVVDSQCGFKLFTRETVGRIMPLCRVDGGMIDVELFFLMHLHDIRCYYQPVHWTNKAGSRINMLRCMLFDPIDMLKILLRNWRGLYRKPLPIECQPWNRGK